MKRTLPILTLTFCFAASVYGQNVIESGYTVFVKEGSSVFLAGIDVQTGGLLDVKSDGSETNISIDGEITGDERINFDGELTNLSVDNGTWDVLWPVVDGNDEVVNTLTLGDAGFVIVPPGNSLTTVGNYTSTKANLGADPDVSITLQADATPAYAQFLPARDGGTVSDDGVMMAEQYLTSDAKAGWRQLSSPVNSDLTELGLDQTLFYDGTTGPGGILPSTPDQYNIFWYDASAIGGGAGLNASANTSSTFSGANAKHWKSANTLSGPSTIGPNTTNAWNIYSGGGFPGLDPVTKGKISLDGTFGFGPYAYDCYTTHDYVYKAGETPVSINQNLITGWNLIPNPYPSNIDVATLLSNVFFDDVLDPNAYAAIHVWDPSTPGTDLSVSGLPAELQQYVAITNDGLFTHVNWNTGNGLDDSGPYIAPFQAFWVKTERTPTTGSLSVTKTLTLTNTERTVTKGNNYFKNTPPLIRLNVFDQGRDGYRDQTVLAFDPSSTEAIDANDAYKFISPNEWVPSLYTKVDGALMTINRLPNPDPAYSIPVYMDSKKAGEPYTFAMVEEDINPSWTIFLEDVKTGKMHNLRNGEYAFTHDASMKINRFVVHINKFPGNIDVNTWNNVNIYANADGINVAFANPDVASAEVTISNLAGQLIYTGTVSTGRVFTFPINEDIALYAVQVVTGTKVTHDKVVK